MARCPQCTRYFCRECVTDHDGRLMCRSCLATAAAADVATPRAWGKIVWPLLAAAGWLLAWFLAYAAGDLLTRVPDSWHGVPGA